jgi:hypothetical protein
MVVELRSIIAQGARRGEDHSRWISFEELSMIGGSHNKDLRIGW